jgi:2-oxoglutarate ferredoxin oxidoreductase subunit beta
MKDHDEPITDVTFVPAFEEIEVDYEPGASFDATMHDGSKLHLRKLEEDYDPANKAGALKRLAEAHEREEVLTGVFYLDANAPDFLEMLHVAEEPLATLPPAAVRPPREALERIMESLR